MLNCTIYTLISTITLGFTCFERFCKFRLCEPSYVCSMKILRPCGSKMIATEAQRYLIRTNCGPYHNTEGSRRISWAKEENQCDQWPPRSIRAGPLFPQSSCFLCSCLTSRWFSHFGCRIYVIKGLFLVSFHPNHPIPFLPSPSNHLFGV